MGGAFIKLDGSRFGRVHIRGTNVNPCVVCGFLAGYQCDYPVGKGKTCDAFLCKDHAISQGEIQPRMFGEPADSKRHFCPAHVANVGPAKGPVK
jgi:hypothetical protein